MAVTKNGGYLTLKIHLLNGRLFNRLLANDGRALYNAEQGKIISALWDKRPQTASELAKVTGLANSTLTLMLKRLEEEQGLVVSVQDKQDKRKKWFDLTETGVEQEQVGNQISDKLSSIFYEGFEEREIREVEAYLERILCNLETAMAAIPRVEAKK
ncbi:MAG: MarR family transcriptional regulator [Eubacteriales bacterium]|nr:MarR family transcriptional regulator [Eubacteriales bacterium]